MTMAAIAAVAPWSICANGVARTLAASRVAKTLCVKPIVDKIVNAGNTNHQATMIRAVLDHTALAAACMLAGILSTKDQAVASYVSEQTVWMLERARSNLRCFLRERANSADVGACTQQLKGPWEIEERKTRCHQGCYDVFSSITHPAVNQPGNSHSKPA